MNEQNFILLGVGVFFLMVFIINIYILFFKKGKEQNRVRKTKKSGYLYVIKNPCFKANIYKIGMTRKDSVVDRMKSLYSTSVPQPFIVVYAIKHRDPYMIEQYLHKEFKKYRINNRREFFKMNIRTIEKELEKLDLI